MLELLLEDVRIVKPFRDYATAAQWLMDKQETVI